jgi:hypothetical protein
MARNGAVADRQLTFDVGEFDVPAPAASTFKVKAVSSATAQLEAGDECRLVLTDTDGTVLVESEGRVTGVAFVRHPETAKQAAWVERVQTVTPIE